MATFTSNYWVTGETITANKLNGNWGGLVTYNADEGFPEEGINIGTGLGVGELINLRFCSVSTETDSQNNTHTAYNYFNNSGVTYIPDTNEYFMYLTMSNALTYNPITGILFIKSSGSGEQGK